jgi:hypothetical protein
MARCCQGSAVGLQVQTLCWCALAVVGLLSMQAFLLLSIFLGAVLWRTVLLHTGITVFTRVW